MVDVLTEIQINKPLNLVAAYSADPENTTHWYVNIKSSKRLDEGPLKVGSLTEFKAEFLGKSMAYTYKVIELTPTKLVMATEQGPFPMETTYTWTEVDQNKTQMTLRNRGNPSGFSKILTPFMIMAMRKANKKDLIKLKSILEGR